MQEIVQRIVDREASIGFIYEIIDFRPIVQYGQGSLLSDAHTRFIFER